MTCRLLRRAGVLAALVPLTAGCVPAAIVAAGGATAVAVSQERTVRDRLTDNEIGLSINNALLNESGTLFRRVGVDVQEGRVVLTGGVADTAQSVRAAEIAWATPGVVAVSNEIMTDQAASSRRYAQDVWITTQVRARLLSDDRIASTNYSVETHDGVVHLTGLARSPEELERATRQAALVSGVREVVSHVLAIDDPRRRPPTPQPTPPRTPVAAQVRTPA
jgi:osmotically-inducible protein OsmY